MTRKYSVEKEKDAKRITKKRQKIGESGITLGSLQSLWRTNETQPREERPRSTTQAKRGRGRGRKTTEKMEAKRKRKKGRGGTIQPDRSTEEKKKTISIRYLAEIPG